MLKGASSSNKGCNPLLNMAKSSANDCCERLSFRRFIAVVVIDDIIRETSVGVVYGISRVPILVKGVVLLIVLTPVRVVSGNKTVDAMDFQILVQCENTWTKQVPETSQSTNKSIGVLLRIILARDSLRDCTFFCNVSR